MSIVCLGLSVSICRSVCLGVFVFVSVGQDTSRAAHASAMSIVRRSQTQHFQSYHVTMFDVLEDEDTESQWMSQFDQFETILNVQRNIYPPLPLLFYVAFWLVFEFVHA